MGKVAKPRGAWPVGITETVSSFTSVAEDGSLVHIDYNFDVNYDPKHVAEVLRERSKRRRRTALAPDPTPPSQRRTG